MAGCQENSDIVGEASSLGLRYNDEGFFYYPGSSIVGRLGAPSRRLPFIRETPEGYEVGIKKFYGGYVVTTESPRLAVFFMLHIWARDKRRNARRFIAKLVRTAAGIANKCRLGNAEVCSSLYRGVGCESEGKLLAAAASLYSITRYESFREPLEPSLQYLMGSGDLRKAGISGKPYLPSSLAILLKLASGSARSEEAYKRIVSIASKVTALARRDYFRARAGWLLAKKLVTGVDLEKMLPAAVALACSGHIRGPFSARLVGFDPFQALFSEIALLLGTQLLIEVRSPVEAASTTLSLDSNEEGVHVSYQKKSVGQDTHNEEWVKASSCNRLTRDKIALVVGRHESVECVKDIIARGLGAVVSSDGSNTLVKPLDKGGELVIYRVRGSGLKSLEEAFKASRKPCVLDLTAVYRTVYRWGPSMLEELLLRCKRY